MSTWNDRLGVFDLETTGVDPDTARIVSACVAVLDRDGEVVSRWDWLADPGVEIPDGAAGVHGITTERARAEGRPAHAVVAEIAQTLRVLLDTGTPVVVYNAPYDLTLLDRECRRHGAEALAAPSPIVDPLVIDKAVDTYRRGKRTLELTAQQYGVLLDGAHDAGADAIAAGRVAQALARAYPDQLEVSWADLHGRQEVWFAEQAASFEQYIRERKGDTTYTAPREWPFRPLLDPESWADTAPIPPLPPRPSPRVPVLVFDDLPRALETAASAAESCGVPRVAGPSVAGPSIAGPRVTAQGRPGAPAPVPAASSAGTSARVPIDAPPPDASTRFQGVTVAPPPTGEPIEMRAPAATPEPAPVPETAAQPAQAAPQEPVAEQAAEQTAEVPAEPPAAESPVAEPPVAEPPTAERRGPRPRVIRIASAIIADAEGRTLLVRRRGGTEYGHAGCEVPHGQSALEALTRELADGLMLTLDMSDTEFLGSFETTVVHESGAVVQTEVFALTASTTPAAGGSIDEVLWLDTIEAVDGVPLSALSRDTILPLWNSRRPAAL